MNSHKPIILIEDDKIDAMTVTRALGELGIENELVHFPNGKRALDHLHDPKNHLPCLIILDLNMPVMDGIEFLRKIKSDECLARIPAVVLTTSREESDKIDSFSQSVAGYMVKPVSYQQFVELMEKLDHYWTASELPESIVHYENVSV